MMGNFYRVCEPQNSGTGANMHFSSYLTPCYFIPSPGTPLPLTDFDHTWTRRNVCTALVQPSSLNHNLVYEKEIIRQAMLKHEAAFRYQVRELHRLYKRQKELKAGHRTREIAAHQLQYHRSQSDGLVYPVQPDFSQKTVPPWLVVNAEGCVPSTLGERYLQRLSCAGDSLQSYNKSFLTKRVPADNEDMPPKISQFGKRMLDLEIPADLYIHSDGEDNSICKNIADVPPTPRKLAKETPEFHLKSAQPYPFDTTGSLNINSSCGGTKFCIDLNEPIQLDDDSYCSRQLNSATCSTQTFPLSPFSSRKPVNESNTSNEDNVLNVLSPGEKQVEHQPFNLEAESDEDILAKNSLAKGNRLGSDIPCESHDSPITFGSCPLCSPPLVSHSADSDCQALSVVTSQRKSLSDLREAPLAVEALPCFNTTKLTKGPKSVYASFSNHSNELGKEPFQVHTCLAKKMKHSHDHELLEYVDLNRMPLDFETLPENDCKEDPKAHHSSDHTIPSSFDDRPLLPFPFSCKLVPSMSDGNVIVEDNAHFSCDAVSVKNDEGILGKETDCERFSCSKDLNFHLDEDEAPAASSQSATVIKLEGTEDLNIEAPTSPENSECHPPRGDFEDKFEIPPYFPKEDEFSVGELEKIVAEAIVPMSSSRGAMTPEPSRLLDNCLNWFAGIAASVSEDLCDEIKELSNKAADSNDQVLGSFRTSNLDTRKVKVRRTNDSSCRGKRQNKQGEIYECLTRLPFHGRRSKQPRILKEKYLHTIGTGRRTDVASGDVKTRKKNTGNGSAKRKPLVTFTHRNDLEQLMFLSPICNAKAKIVGNCLHGWGSRSGRHKARRARTVFDVFLHNSSSTDC